MERESCENRECYLDFVDAILNGEMSIDDARELLVSLRSDVTQSNFFERLVDCWAESEFYFLKSAYGILDSHGYDTDQIFDLMWTEFHIFAGRGFALCWLFNGHYPSEVSERIQKMFIVDENMGVLASFIVACRSEFPAYNC